MAILKKTLFSENLDRYGVFVNDTELNSKYFKITELSDTFTGGKNAFLIQGSEYLVSDTLIKIEIKDAQGNIIYHEPGEGIPEYFEGTSKVVAVYIYPDTSFGPCTITILGELSSYDNAGLDTPIPMSWEGKYNVKWQRQINVNPLLANTTKVRFYRRPKIDISESVLPIYNRTVTTKTISGSIDATPINPPVGSDYRTFKGILQYELSTTASVFSQSMEGEIITINGLANTYSPTISDVTSDRKAFVNIPYYVTSSLASNYYSTTAFTNQPFTLSFEEQVTLTNSNVSSSFARIKITDLETFSGDANRIKVYASSKNDLGDYQLLEDITLESNELLQVDEFLNELNVRTGLFSQQVLNSYWLSTNESSTLTKTIDNSVLIKSVKLQPANEASSSTGLYRFYTSQSLDFSKNTEYQLDFTPLLSSSFGYGKIEVYATGSAFVNTDNSTTYGKLITELETNTTFRKYDKQQLNFKPDNDGVGQLMFVGKGGTWQLANISLRAAQESAFSPNEITLVANVPTKINNEAFDFKFELYDINNNYVPVTLEKSFTFTGGNDLAVQRDLQLNVSNTAFNFNTASQFPASIQIDFSKTGLTGDVTFLSQAFDTTGQLIVGTPYPGLLEYVDTDTKKLTIDKFTGSLSGVTVGAITYTASCEDINRYFTIFRIEQGAPSYLFYATGDKNNFTFDPDNRYKSVVTDDYIDIRLVQQNLPALAPLGLKIYSGSEAGVGYDPPGLRNMGSIGNATIYRLYVSESVDNPIPSNNYNFGLGQSHYDFELNTVDGKFTSSVLIDAIEKGDKGKGVFASADKNQFFYKMTDLVPTPTSQTITILVKRQNLGSITNTISVTKTGSGPDLTYVGTAFGVATYTLTAGQSSNYQYSSGTTKYTFTAYDLNGVSYSDEITIAPVISESQISVNLSNENATLPAWSNGFVESGSFILSSGSVSLKVGGEDIIFDDDADGMANNTYAVLSLTGINCTPNGGQTSNPTNVIYGITTLTKDSGSLDIVVRYKDGRGVNTDVSKSVTYTKNKKAAPVLQITSTPKAQSVSAKSTGAQIDSFSNATISVSEVYNGSTTSKTITSLTATSSDISSISTTPSTGLITLNGKTLADGTNATSVAITAQVVDSEGTTRTIYDTLSLSKVKKAPPTITFAITPSSQTVAANSAGTLTGTIVDPVLTAFEGSSALTYNQGTLSASQYKITNVTGVTVGSTIPSTSTIDVTGISATDNTGEVTIAYVDSEGTSGTSTIKFTISKAIAGVQGTDGNTGADGKRTATGMVHYQVVATSAPSTPSATSYTFSNGTFGSLTANWATGAPTYASGNSNKYWYATYSVVETTAGGGIGVPSFGTPTQAIGFSGLVSFSGASGVSDGTNALSFGVAGTTLINGSNISTGKIISTNYSAGTPFTAAGSIIDLDNGRIATKTFYVDANGDAVFKGTLSAAGGTFAGQITVGGTDYATSAFLNANTTATQVGLGNVSNLGPQSQAQTGLNSGTTITGGGVTLNGGGSIKGGQTDYNTGTGFFLGYSGGDYKFSIGNASSKGITWNGSTLAIGGEVTIGGTLADTIKSGAASGASALQSGQTGKSLGLTGGSVGGVTIASDKIYVGTGTYGNANTGFYVDSSGNMSLKDKLTWDGTTLSITGTVVITGGATKTAIETAQSAANTAQSTADSKITGAQVNANVTSISGGVIQTNTINATQISALQFSGKTAVFDQGSVAGWTMDATGLYKTSGAYTLRLGANSQRISISEANSVDTIDRLRLDSSLDIPAIVVSDTGSVNYSNSGQLVAQVYGDDATPYEYGNTGFVLGDGGGYNYGYGWGIVGLQYGSEEIFIESEYFPDISNIIWGQSGFGVNDQVYGYWNCTLRVRKYPTANDAVNETNQDTTYATKEVLVAYKEFRYYQWDTNQNIDRSEVFGATIPAAGQGGINTPGVANWYRIEINQSWYGQADGGSNDSEIRIYRPASPIYVKFGRVANGYSVFSPGGLQVYQGVRNYMNASLPSGSVGDSSNFFIVKGKSQIIGSLNVTSGLSANSKQFKIQHPINENKWLYHTSTESPRADLIYRGTLELHNGSGSVSIDFASNMTIGTFDALTKNPQLFLQNNESFDRIKGYVESGSVYVLSENENSSATIDWSVIAERKDTQILKSPLYDRNGKYKTETYKSEYLELTRPERLINFSGSI